MAVPMLTAYGTVYDGGGAFIGLALAAFIPFLIIPAAIGSALTLILVNAFPARRTRDILSVIAVLAAAGIVVLFRLVRPEKLARPEGFRSLVDFIAILRTPTSPLLPSEWVGRSVMGWLTGTLDLLPLYLLWSTAAAAIVVGALLHQWLYARGFTKAQESGERWAREGWLGRTTRWALAPLGVVRRELVLKEVRVFFRDTTQWSQLILLAVLVVVYVFNIKFLPLTGEGITFFIVNLIPFLNLALAGFVLASVAARFIFPGVSLEGRTWWLLRASPLSMRELLWAKFWVGMVPLLVLALAIVGVTNSLLQRERVHVRGLGVHDHADDVRAGGARDRVRHGVSAIRDGERGADPDVVRGTAVHDERGRRDRCGDRARGAAGVQLRLGALVPRRRAAASPGARARLRARGGGMPNGNVLADPGRDSPTRGVGTLGGTGNWELGKERQQSAALAAAQHASSLPVRPVPSSPFPVPRSVRPPRNSRNSRRTATPAGRSLRRNVRTRP